MLKKEKTLLGFITFLCIIALLGMVYISQSSKKKSEKIMYSYKKTSNLISLSINGKIRSREISYIDIPNESNDTHVTLFVKDSQLVNKGDIIYQKINLSKQQQLDDIKRELNSLYRKRSLTEQTINIKQNERPLTQQDKDSQLLDIQESKNNLSNIQDEINQKLNTISVLNNQLVETVYADYAGLVSLQSGEQKIVLYSEKLEATGDITEYDYFKVHKDQNAYIKSTINNRKESTNITSVSNIPSSEKPQSPHYKIEVYIHKKFLLGQSVKIIIPSNLVVLPSKAIIKNNRKYFVIVKRGNKNVKTQIFGSFEGDYFYSKKGIKSKEFVKVYK